MLLGVETYKSDFDGHIKNGGIKQMLFAWFKKKKSCCKGEKILANTFVILNFNYYSLAWHFSTRKR